MGVRKIFLISLWGLLVLVGGFQEGKADETDALRTAIWNERNNQMNSLLGNACSGYCGTTDKCSCGSNTCGGDFDFDPRPLPKTWAGSKCIFDFFETHPTLSQTFIVQNASAFPQVVINDHKNLMGRACQAVCTPQACLKNDQEILNQCMSLCCDISQDGTDYLADCYTKLPHYGNGLCGNYLQSEKFYGHKPQTKANAVMAPHPLVIRQNNKALRGNAPQTMKGRPVNQNQQSRMNTQNGQPRVMPPLNQGKIAPGPQHPGMMHVDPHHPTLMPPVNQGKNAPGPHHPAAMPVENRGRTTPPRMMTVPHAGGDPSQNMQPHSNAPHHSGMMPVPNRGQAASPQNSQQHPGLMRPLPPHLVDIERPKQPER